MKTFASVGAVLTALAAAINGQPVRNATPNGRTTGGGNAAAASDGLRGLEDFGFGYHCGCHQDQRDVVLSTLTSASPFLGLVPTLAC